MGAAAEVVRTTYAEYLALERRTDQRYEFFDGEVLLMAGGSPRHAKVISNSNVAFGAALGDRACQAFSSELKVRIPQTGATTHPDLCDVVPLSLLGVSLPVDAVYKNLPDDPA